jgi:hypothetical protein
VRPAAAERLAAQGPPRRRRRCCRSRCCSPPGPRTQTQPPRCWTPPRCHCSPTTRTWPRRRGALPTWLGGAADARRTASRAARPPRKAPAGRAQAAEPLWRGKETWREPHYSFARLSDGLPRGRKRALCYRLSPTLTLYIPAAVYAVYVTGVRHAR